jgi:hypothetical protein
MKNNVLLQAAEKFYNDEWKNIQSGDLPALGFLIWVF